MICNLPRVNYVAVGIAMMLFGMGLAFYLGKPYVQPSAPRLPALELGYLVIDRASADRPADQSRCLSLASPWRRFWLGCSKTRDGD